MQNPLSESCKPLVLVMPSRKEPSQYLRAKNLLSSSMGKQSSLKMEIAEAEGMESILPVPNSFPATAEMGNNWGTTQPPLFLLINWPFYHQREIHTQATLANTKIQGAVFSPARDIY